MSIAPDLSDFTLDEIRDTLAEVRNPVSIAIYGSTNYFNVGAIIRTSHGFLVDSIILIECPAYYEKASMGTDKYENILHMTEQEFLDFQDKANVVAFERRTTLCTESLYEYTYPRNPVLLFGGEKEGIPDSLLYKVCGRVSIPLMGLHYDLNLSVAAGIALYDWMQKCGKR